MAYSVRVLKVGQSDIPGPEAFWMSAWGEWHTIFFTVLLLREGDATVLVNTGPPEDLSPINDAWPQLLGDERAALVRDSDDELLARLAAVGVRPEEVTHLVLTPLQLYSTGGLRHFPNAQICLSRKGWVHFHTTHSHPHDDRWHSIGRDDLVYLVTDAWERVRLLEDEDEIKPGLRTWWAGTHHRASLAIEADTSAGVVVASDAFFFYENVEANRVLGICENLYEALECYARARGAADVIVPLYEPAVFERHEGGVIAG